MTIKTGDPLNGSFFELSEDHLVRTMSFLDILDLYTTTMNLKLKKMKCA